MDGLFWGPNWTESDHDAFRERVDLATSQRRWVADADYLPRIGTLVWERADTVVWLDVPTSLILRRLVRRTIKRSILRTKLWAGNRESLSNLFNKGSLRRWVETINAADRATYEEMFADDRWSHIDRIRVETVRELESWLRSV
jgi:adenylate kinase family enzyme